MYSGSPAVADAISVKAGLLGRHRRLVSAETIEVVDPVSRVVGLRIDRRGVRTLL